MQSEITIRLAEKSEKTQVKRFYRSQKYSASFIGHDKVYLLEQKQVILAAVIISTLDDTNFLHALVVTKQHQGQGLATQMLTNVCQDYSEIYCFADIKLSPLYLSKNFEQCSFEHLPIVLANRYSSYQKSRPQLAIFYYKNSLRKEIQ